MYAVIKTGGKQYRVAPNDVITIEKVAGSPGDVVEFSDVLLLSGDKGVEVGNPQVSGVTIAAEILRQERGDTIIVFKKRRRHHYRRRNGHRQALTALKITEILTDGKKPERKAQAPSEAARPDEGKREAAPRKQPKAAAGPKTRAGTAAPKTRAKPKPKTKE
jgi:large subunit ribosomal protein L21